MKAIPRKDFGESMARKMREAVARGVFPGGVLVVGHRNQVLMHEAFGHASLVPRKISMTRQTRFDLASLTKPLATTTAVMVLMHDGILALSDPVQRWIPSFRKGAKSKVTIFHLLNHSSGLPGWRPYYRHFTKTWQKLGLETVRQRMFNEAHEESLTYPVGSRSLYSDVGFILLGEIVEKSSGLRLDQFSKQRIFDSLGLSTLRFRKVRSRVSRTSRFAATERCPWRKHVIQGEVHDGNAHMMGGVAGHAGLFGTAMDVYHMTRCIVDASERNNGFLPSNLVSRFLDRTQTPNSSWALGWDTPSVPSSSGRFFSRRSIGHLGFTGCSVWCDRDRDLTMILLTNRVHPSSRRTRIRIFRPFIHDQVAQEIFS